MTAIQAGLLVLCGFMGTAVVFTRDPRRQAILMGINGIALSLLFLALQAPDVALSELAVGTVILPLLFLATLAALRGHAAEKSEKQAK